MWTLNAEWKLPEEMLELANDSTEKQNQNLKSWIYNKLKEAKENWRIWKVKTEEITMKETRNSYRDD